MSETKSEMIRRALIQPMMARYRLPDRFSSVAAGIEDYTEAMLPFAEAAIAEGFRRVKLEHEYPWWPDLPKLVASVRVAASEAAARGGVGSSDRGDLIAHANARGHSYARWYMDQLRWHHVAAAWNGGYFREMRLFLTAAATRQMLDGTAEPHVEIPKDTIKAWEDAARERGSCGSMSAETREAANRLCASIQARAERLNAVAK